MSEQITLIEIVRAAGLGVLPPGGAWVCIKGMSHFGAPRNHRIIPAHCDIGIQHMDIYWAMSEEPTFDPHPLAAALRALGKKARLKAIVVKNIEGNRHNAHRRNLMLSRLFRWGGVEFGHEYVYSVQKGK